MRAAGDELDVVGRDRNAAACRDQTVEDPGQLALGAVVEPARRLVEQDDARRRCQLHGEYQREPLPFGEIARVRVRVDTGRDALDDGRARGRGRARDSESAWASSSATVSR